MIFSASGGPHDRNDTMDLPDADEMEAKIIEAIKTVYDPEIPVNIYELGLIYSLERRSAGQSCRYSDDPDCARLSGRRFDAGMGGKRRPALAGVESVNVEMVWEPPWNPDLQDVHARQAGISSLSLKSKNSLPSSI
jgi:metal-sulfur cluster biosynthetic enzyme